MTQEEKAKAYDEALERAKKLKEGFDGYNANVAIIEQIFPELRESEDERIRKWIVNLLHELHYNQTAQPMALKAIEWLEKQKEPENTSASVMAPSCWEVEQKPYEPKNWPADKDNLTQEQKPAECIEDSVKFEEGFKTGRESGLRDGQKYVLNNLDSYGLCKVAEWSEEDEKNCNRIIRFLEPHKTFFPTKEIKEEMQNWLKNRLKSLRPQPHWKPSKDQMKVLLNAEGLLRADKRLAMAQKLAELYEQLKKLM